MVIRLLFAWGLFLFENGCGALWSCLLSLSVSRGEGEKRKTFFFFNPGRQASLTRLNSLRSGLQNVWTVVAYVVKKSRLLMERTGHVVSLGYIV